ncbi:hypothetical protein QCA50_015291 [Cerrena zonata]|uniref:N-acetyltransferase domain-containing protein n=1 Tax=Cerrena zonata TaxID=2478898 RepID=A0AAW0FR76_9APHY
MALFRSTERLNLRSYKESDLDTIQDLWNELEVQQNTAMDHVVPRGPKFKETIKGWLDNDRFHAIIEVKETNEFVGLVTIRDDNVKNRDGDLAINLTKSQWGKGYGQEVLKFVVDYAFRGLRCHRLSLGVFDSNERAVKLYKKIGFVEEGRIRKANWVDGEWRDVVLMAILDEEWKAELPQ